MDVRIVAFIGISAALIVVPGPDMVLIARNTITGGHRTGFMTAAGTLVGVLVHAVAAILGLSAIIATSAAAFTALKLVGAAYLIYLGIQSFVMSRRSGVGLESGSRTNTRVSGSGFMQGVLTNVLNPKVALFFLTFLPQFIDPGEAVTGQTVLLAGIFWVMGAVWLAFYTLLVGRISSLLARPRVAQVLQRMSAVILGGLGLRLAVERR